MKKYTVLIFLVLFLVFSIGWSQVENDDPIEDHDFTRQLWFDLEPSWHLNEQSKLVGEVSYRTVEPKSWHRLIFRASKRTSKDSILFKGFKHSEGLQYGVGTFFFMSDYQPNSFEIRPFQGYSLGFNISPRFNLGQLVRAEERFLFTNNETHKFFGLRLRYQVTGTIDLKGVLFQQGRGFYLPVSIEAFFNLVKVSQFNDVIRISPGIGYQVNPDFKFLFSLAYHYTKQGADDNKLIRTNDLVVRFRILRTF